MSLKHFFLPNMFGLHGLWCDLCVGILDLCSASYFPGKIAKVLLQNGLRFIGDGAAVSSMFFGNFVHVHISLFGNG